MLQYQHVLIVLLEEQSYPVTFTLDLLLQAGYPIQRVVALHLNVASRPRLQSALEGLHAELVNDYVQGVQHSLSFASYVLKHKDQPLHAIVDDEHADAALDSVRHVLSEEKHRGNHIHLLISDGHPLVALLTLSLAMITFDRYDHIWYLYMPEHIREEMKDDVIAHVVPESGVHLIQGPFPLLGAYLSTSFFRTIGGVQDRSIVTQERARCEEVVRQARPAELKVLRAFAEGLRPQQVAEKLRISPVTVHSHKTVLLQYCRLAWKRSNEPLSYHFLQLKFAEYFGYQLFPEEANDPHGLAT